MADPRIERETRVDPRTGIVIAEDILVYAPSALVQPARTRDPAKMPITDGDMPTPREIIKMQSAEIRVLEEDLEKLRYTASTIANVACCLIELLHYYSTTRGNAIMVPKELSEKMRGAEIAVRQDGDKNVWVRYTHRAETPVVET